MRDHSTGAREQGPCHLPAVAVLRVCSHREGVLTLPCLSHVCSGGCAERDPRCERGGGGRALFREGLPGRAALRHWILTPAHPERSAGLQKVQCALGEITVGEVGNASRGGQSLPTTVTKLSFQTCWYELVLKLLNPIMFSFTDLWVAPSVRIMFRYLGSL